MQCPHGLATASLLLQRSCTCRWHDRAWPAVSLGQDTSVYELLIYVQSALQALLSAEE